ncbi:MAG: peptidase C25, partial [Thermoplasmata archaeon]|nr:peptidase C25 [Thermoplasmata archaeon]
EYENSNAYEQSWFKRMVVVGGDSWPKEGDPYFEGEEENKLAIEYMKEFEPIKLWTSLGTLTGPQDVINAVNPGCGFLFFDGHGNPMNWATHPPYNESSWIDGLGVSDMHKFDNKGMYPVCIVGGCHNSQFNVSLLNTFKIYEGFKKWYSYLYKGENSPESWGWWIVRMANKGAIASLGFAGLDYFATGDNNNDSIPDCTQFYSGFMNVNFFKEYANGTSIIGEIQGNVVTKYVSVGEPMKDNIACKTIEEWVLLGDPSLRIGGYS